MSRKNAMLLFVSHPINQRHDHDPKHDLAIPLYHKPAAPQSGRAVGTSDGAPEKYALGIFCYEHEICNHTFTNEKSDFVEISVTAASMTAGALLQAFASTANFGLHLR